MSGFQYTDNAGSFLSLSVGQEDGEKIVRFVAGHSGSSRSVIVDVPQHLIPAFTAFIAELANTPIPRCNCGTTSAWHQGNCDAM